MDRRALKNSIIFILLCVNLFLCSNLLRRREAEQRSWTQSVAQLTELLQADGITLDSASIPRDTPPEAFILTHNASYVDRVAKFLFGSSATHSLFGGNDRYSSPYGEALFRENGSFEVTRIVSEEDAESFCRRFSRAFSLEQPTLTLDSTRSGTACATAIWNNLLVHNAYVLFEIAQNRVVAIHGRLLPDSGEKEEYGEEALSVLAALAAFQQMRRENSAVASKIYAIRLCYEFQSTTAAPMGLTPAWYFEMDAADYYVNCFSGEVSVSTRQN